MLAPHKTGETTADFTGKRVLLAEDNALNAEIAVELLQSIGLKVDWAEDGQKAVEMFEKSAPGSYFAVFMDMQMPVMDGLTATREIRLHEVAMGMPRTPVVMLTANALPEHIAAGMEAGADRHLAKPFSIEALLAMVSELTADTPQAASAAA